MMGQTPCLGRTWVTRMAVCTYIVARNILHKILKGLFIPRLLALAHDARHWRVHEQTEVFNNLYN